MALFESKHRRERIGGTTNRASAANRVPFISSFFAGGGIATHIDEREKQARQLEQTAKTLSKKSAKYAALTRAAWALAFVTMQHHSEFQKFLSDHQSRELSPSEQKHFSRAVYVFVANKDNPTNPIVSTPVRLTCPAAIVGSHYRVNRYSAPLANVATNGLIGLAVEILRGQLNKLKLILASKQCFAMTGRAR